MLILVHLSYISDQTYTPGSPKPIKIIIIQISMNESKTSINKLVIKNYLQPQIVDNLCAFWLTNENRTKYAIKSNAIINS